MELLLPEHAPGARESNAGTGDPIDLLRGQLEKLSGSIERQLEAITRLEAALAAGDNAQSLRATRESMTGLLMFQVVRDQLAQSAAAIEATGNRPEPAPETGRADNTGRPGKDRDRLYALAASAEALSSSLDPAQVLYQAMETLMELTGAERAFLLMADADSGELKFEISRNFEEETMHGTSFAVSRTIVDSVVRDGVPVVTTNAAADPRFSAQESIAVHSLRSIVCVPLKNKEEVFGVIYADHRIKMGQFSETDVDFVAAFASQASTAIQNARLFESVRSGRNLMHNVFESMESGVISVDTSGVITMFNRASERVLDLQASDCIGMPADLVLPVLDGAIMDAIDRVTVSGEPVSEARIAGIIDSRGPVTVSITAGPLADTDGRVSGVTVLVEDHSETARLEEERALVKRYLPAQLVDSLSDYGELGLGGARRNVSVFFADIRGFTGFSENHQPTEVVELINSYFGIATDIVHANNGIIDKYMGDAVMAHYNSPLLSLEDHAWFAVKTAWETKQRMDAFIGQGRSPERPLAFGIGVNTGEALAGNVGADTRMEYTLIGDAVNVAKRLQEMAGPGEVLISEATYELVKDRVEAGPPVSLRVKGRHTAATVYELTGLRIS